MIYILKTRLSWVVASEIASQDSKSAACSLTTNLDQQIVKFWMTEEILSDMPKSIEELDCKAHFAKNSDERYVVLLPFRMCYRSR